VDVAALIAQANGAHAALGAMSLTGRLEQVAWSAERLRERGEEIVDQAVRECGQPRRFAQRELASALLLLRALPELAEVIRPRPVPALGGATTLEWRPYGTLFGWHAANSPVWVPTVVIASGLVAGNAVISRPSRRAAQTTALVIDALAEGWPEGAVGIADGTPEECESLICHSEIHVVVAHASTATCRRHLSRLGAAYSTGAPLRPYIPEASGNDALIVLAGADLDAAARGIGVGAFSNQGQLCMAAKRLVVQRSIWDELRPRIAEQIGGLVLGDPDHERTDVAPLPEGPARRQARGMLAEARALGGHIVCGHGEDGPFMTPTIVELPEAARAGELWNEECFAPLRGLALVDDVDEAVAVAGDSRFGLGVAIFAEAPLAHEIGARMRVGRVIINADPLYQDPHLVVGGVGDSGMFGARPKLEQFVYACRVHEGGQAATPEPEGAATR
jgi:acyl-CoA reductase-like NAD-dependent aldehyde dehydrogenase